jgi:hypothetical protein
MRNIEEYLDWRLIQDPCEECGGTGKKTYGSTATFWGGIGGQAMTTSVCDHCWGSGDKYKPWKSWKLIDQELKDRAPLYDRLRIAIWNVLKSYELDGDGTPPTFGRPSIVKAWAQVKTVLTQGERK